MRYIMALAAIILLQGNLSAQPNIMNKFLIRSHTLGGTTLPYRLFIPDAYTSAKRYPVVLALHGAGESGTDNTTQLTRYRMATCWADSANQAKHPCFIVAPQCPASGSWGGRFLATANDILDSLVREFSIDTNRFYVTGLSMGGNGTWNIIWWYPGRFAAAVPMSDNPNPAYAYMIADVPIWNFHGAVDNLALVQYSRAMIDALHALGRPVVYTHCHNLDCSGLPDSTIAMYVRSHADLFYTETQNDGHTVNFWNASYDYPFLAPWVFDKYRKQPGAITLTNLKSYRTLSGTASITWSTSAAGDSVEIWFSPDAGKYWQPIVASAPNTGTFIWNSSLTPDCAFGSVQVFLRNAEGFIIGSDRSSYFAVNNTQNGTPFVSLLNEEFATGAVFAQDSLDLKVLAGDPAGASLAASLLYSNNGGSTFGQFDSFTAPSSPASQTRRIGISPLPNSSQAVIGLTVSNGKLASRATTFPFSKITPRLAGTAVTHTSGGAGATVTVHVVSPSALTGHHYQVRFDDTSSAQKQYAVRDVDHGSVVVQHATELDGVTEGPLFDGIRLVIADVLVPRVNTDSTRWTTGSATMQVTIHIPYGGKPNFDDYRITLFSTVVDTSKAAFGQDATLMKFLVWNLTKNKKADVTFRDLNGDNTIGSLDEVDILLPDSTRALGLSWGIVFYAQSGAILPVPGDQFVLRTVKPVSSSDVYEFTGTVSSVRTGATPLAFSLEQNYPNPFNPVTVIRYGLPGASHVSLTVYDILGRQVSVLVNEREDAGVHEVRFNGTGLSSGVYFYRMQAGSFVETRKLLLLR